MHFSKSDIADFLARSVGNEKANATVREVASKLSMSDGPYQPSEALAILDAIAQEPGVLGIAARFAMSRILLSKKK